MNRLWRLAVCTLALHQPLWAGEPPAVPAPAPVSPAAPTAPAEAEPLQPGVITPPVDKGDNKAGVTPAPLPLTDLRTFVDVFERIRQSYVDPVDDRTLFENAIRGMLSALDPHSAYLDKDDYQDLKAQTSGEFGGIGIEMGMEDGYLRVISPIDDTPASQAGIRAGDYITRIEGKAVKGMTMAEAVEAMRGAIGTPLKLTIQRRGESSRNLTLVRARIEMNSIRSRMLDPNYAVIRISQFQTHTGRDLNKALLDLKQQQPKLKGIILDLRNNPGGILGSAISVADAFLDKGLVVYTKARTEESIERFEATEGQVIPNIPLLVLVNGSSASASEIVAGALQDQHRALIAGTPTFGKGSVQTVLQINEEKGIKLTTARYYTPSGRSIQAEGIVPDVLIEPATLALVKGGDSYREADLKGHLANPNAAAQAADATNSLAPAEDAPPTVEPASEKTKSDKKSADKSVPAKTKEKAKKPAKTESEAPTVTDTEAAPEGDDTTAADAKPSNEKVLAEEDYVLYAALNVLKGATLWQGAVRNETGKPIP